MVAGLRSAARTLAGDAMGPTGSFYTLGSIAGGARLRLDVSRPFSQAPIPKHLIDEASQQLGRLGWSVTAMTGNRRWRKRRRTPGLRASCSAPPTATPWTALAARRRKERMQAARAAPGDGLPTAYEVAPVGLSRAYDSGAVGDIGDMLAFQAGGVSRCGPAMVAVSGTAPICCGILIGE